MSDVIIKVENLSKQYRLGKVGRRTIRHDVNRWLYRMMGKEDPYLKIGEENDRSKKGMSDYVWALKDINFEVKQGDILGIIGKNGAGKSTLLKILSKVTSPTTGQLKVKGRIASLLEVGTGFHPELSGRDNIFLNGAILGMTKKEIKSKFDEIVDFSGVERYIDTPVKRYSSGMYVRLAFAVAAHLDPEILIIDEVLAVGDAEFQKKCLGKMRDVSAKDGRTVLFVSHYMPAVLNLCTYAMVLQFGKKVFEGDVEKAINYYSNLSRKKDSKMQSIQSRDDRQGNGFIYCTDISILDKELKPTDSLKSGDEVNLRIDYKIRRSTIRSVAFRIQILDATNQIIFTCNNHHSTELFEIDKDGSAICTIPKLPLFGGTYYINITIFSLEEGLLDEVEFAKELSVMDGDFFDTGKIPGIKKGILVPHTWELKKQISIEAGI